MTYLADKILKVYNKVSIRWTTHRPKGLTSLDVVAAQLCDSYV
jgi:4a-hydroxytetrahydrobiopterin dehydratase